MSAGEVERFESLGMLGVSVQGAGLGNGRRCPDRSQLECTARSIGPEEAYK